jgi:hypothetical protein
LSLALRIAVFLSCQKEKCPPMNSKEKSWIVGELFFGTLPKNTDITA